MLNVIEFVKVQPGKLRDYVAAAGAEQLSLYHDLGFRLVGYWETVLAQGNWPEVVALWELDGYMEYAKASSQAFGQGALGERYREWQAHLGGLAESSRGRVLSPSSRTPSVEKIQKSGKRAPVCLLQVSRTVPGKSPEYVEDIQKLWAPAAEKHGWWMIGAYQNHGWKNRETFDIWGTESWSTVPPAAIYSELQTMGADAHIWSEVALALRDDWESRLMVALPFSTVS